jgi:hypothetical protein
MQTFIKINDDRLIKSSIKKYKPFGENKINIYFNTSRYRIEMESFTFNNPLDRAFMMEYLEILLGGLENFKVEFFIIVNGLINFQEKVYFQMVHFKEILGGMVILLVVILF